MLKIGIYIKFDMHSFKNKGNVLGDELFGESLCKALRKLDGIEQAELFAPNNPITEPLDVLIYLNDTPPIKQWAKNHILYLQNGYGEEAARLLERFYPYQYDGYVFFSYKLLELHRQNGYEGLFLPFGVDLEFFYPRKTEKEYRFDVAYVGNDIKGEKRTMRYLYPAVSFDFGLFGYWKIPNALFRYLKGWGKLPPYRKAFSSITRGRIPQEKVPVLYSSAKINLNCTLQFCVDWNVVTLRTYEILACQGFLISDRVPIAEETMKDTMVFTDGHEDLTEKIRYYLEHEDERDEIARKGYQYVTEQASISARAKELYEYLQRIQT